MRLLIYANDRDREANAEIAIEVDFNVMDAKLLGLDAAEEMHIGSTAFDLAKFEINRSLRNDFIIRIEESRVLMETTETAAPTRPNAELKKSDGDLRRRNRADDSDESL